MQNKKYASVYRHGDVIQVYVGSKDQCYGGKGKPFTEFDLSKGNESEFFKWEDDYMRYLFKNDIKLLN